MTDKTDLASNGPGLRQAHPSKEIAMIEYIDFDGKTNLTEEEFRALFGAFYVVNDPEAQYHVVKMLAVTGYSTFRLLVLDEDEDPVPGIAVRWGWPDGSIVGQTKENGYAEFGMYENAWYKPPGAGPYWVEVDAEHTERITGIGMVFGTNHTHFDVTVREGVVPPPPPPDDEVIWHLLEAQAKNLEVGAHIAQALALLRGE